MILAPFLSGATGIWQEQILVTIDAVSYFVLAVCAVVVAPGVDVDGGDGGALGSLAFFLTVSATVASWRHIQNARSMAHRDNISIGTQKKPPVLTDVEIPAPASSLYLLPITLLWLSLIWLYLDYRAPNTGATLLMLISSWRFFWVFRAHGDHSGGKSAPTLFALMLHAAAALSGTPPHIVLSIHRALALFTYFITGFR